MAQADGRPSDASGTVCTYRVAEAPPYDTPQGHIRVHYVADSADPASPALTATRVAGVPDWVVSAGEVAEDAWARETALGFPAPPADNGDGAERGGDGRYDVYICAVGAPGVGELAATVPDPPGSGFSYVVVDNDYAPREVAPLTNSGVEQLRVSVAHELFHAIQLGESRGRLPEWLAEATAVWMEGEIAPPGRRSRDLPGGARRGRNRAAVLEHGRPPRVRRLVADLGARARPSRVRTPSHDARSLARR